MKRSAIRLVTLAIALGFITNVQSAPAWAGFASWEYGRGTEVGALPAAARCKNWTNAKVCWVADGDSIWVNDKAANGRAAGANWQVKRPDGSVQRFGTCENRLGAVNGWARCTGWDFTESYSIRLMPAECREEGVNCVDLQEAWVTFTGEWGPLWAIGQ